MTVKLVHTSGLYSVEQTTSYYTVDRIVERWRKVYGKKFFECNVEIEGDKAKPKMKVFDSVSGEYYDNIKQAAFESGFHYWAVKAHLAEDIQFKHNYRFFWKEEPK